MQLGAAALARRAEASAVPRDAPVRITATGSMSLFLAGRARQLTELIAAPAPSLAILSTRQRLDVANGDADIALRMRRLPADGAVVARRLGRVAFSIYASRDLLAARTRGTPSDGGCWAGLPMIGLPETSRAPSQSGWLDTFAAAHGAVVALRLGDVALRWQAARTGAGASLLPCFLGDADTALVRLVSPPPDLAEDVHMLIAEQRRHTGSVRTVAAALAQLLRDASGDLDGTGAGA
jgi:hypothetical protein